MPNHASHTEATFETTICQKLEQLGYRWDKNDKNYNPELGIYPQDCLEYLQTTQPDNYQTAIPKTLTKEQTQTATTRLIKKIATEANKPPKTPPQTPTKTEY